MQLFVLRSIRYRKAFFHRPLRRGIDIRLGPPHGTMEPSPTTFEATLVVATGGSWHRLLGAELVSGSAGKGL